LFYPDSVRHTAAKKNVSDHSPASPGSSPLYCVL